LEKLLKPALVKAGFDRKGFDKILKQREAERNRVADKYRAEAIKQSTRIKKTLRSTATRHRDALKKLTADLAPQARRYLITLERPFLIWASPQSNIITDSRIESWNSWAKISFTSSSSGAHHLNFYFLWSNETDYYAVINSTSFVIANGYCQVGRDGGFFPDYRHSGINLRGHHFPMEWWNTPPTFPAFQTGQQQDLFSLSVSGGGFLDVGALDAREVHKVAFLDYNLLLVPPRGTVVFEVGLSVFYSNTHGTVVVDFSSGDFEIMCPMVIISLLTAPPTSGVTPVVSGALLDFTT
jgi:hypothetical protein